MALRCRAPACLCPDHTQGRQTQAVIALKGKPLNTYGLTKKVIYENEEFHLLQAALNIEDGLDGLRYNRIVIAMDGLGCVYVPLAPVCGGGKSA